MRCDDGRLTWLDIDALPAAAAAAAAAAAVAGRTRRQPRVREQNTQASSQTRLLYSGHVTYSGVVRATNLGQIDSTEI